MIQQIKKHITINAIPSMVWKSLTNSELMKQWMGDPEMKIEIITDWKMGSPILIKGFHHAKFENKGIVLEFDVDKVMVYTSMSSLSRLPDVAESYSRIEFRLRPLAMQTELILTLQNFPTETIMKHLDFYWTGTLEIMKNQVEGH